MTDTHEKLFCQKCEAPLTGKIVWLELDQRDQTYHDRRDVPPDKSQGWFPFGTGCAKRIKEEAEISRAVERTQRRIDRAGKPGRFEKLDRNTGSYMDDIEGSSQ